MPTHLASQNRNGRGMEVESAEGHLLACKKSEQAVAKDATVVILVQWVLTEEEEDLHCCNYTYPTKAKDF